MHRIPRGASDSEGTSTPIHARFHSTPTPPGLSIPSKRQLARPLYKRYPSAPKRSSEFVYRRVSRQRSRATMVRTFTVLIPYRSSERRRPLEGDPPFFPASVLGRGYYGIRIVVRVRHSMPLWSPWVPRIQRPPWGPPSPYDRPRSTHLPPRSLATTNGYSVDYLPPGTEMFQFPDVLSSSDMLSTPRPLRSDMRHWFSITETERSSEAQMRRLCPPVRFRTIASVVVAPMSEISTRDIPSFVE